MATIPFQEGSDVVLYSLIFQPVGNVAFSWGNPHILEEGWVIAQVSELGGKREG